MRKKLVELWLGIGVCRELRQSRRRLDFAGPGEEKGFWRGAYLGFGVGSVVWRVWRKVEAVEVVRGSVSKMCREGYSKSRSVWKV